MRILALPVVVATLLAAGSALAQGQGGPPSPEQRFQEMDYNRDGWVTQQEYQWAMDQRWQRMLQHVDTNRDNMVSRDEFLAAPQPPQQPPSRQ